MNIVLLDGNIHQRTEFDCGNDELNFFLKRIANQQLNRDQARTYVLTTTEQPQRILAFYTLTMCRLELEQLPETLQKTHKLVQTAGLIARLGVDKHYQGQGYGRIMLIDALQKLYHASQLVGFPIIFVDAKTGKKGFYQQYGFCALPDPKLENKLYITVETLRKSLVRTS